MGLTLRPTYSHTTSVTRMDATRIRLARFRRPISARLRGEGRWVHAAQHVPDMVAQLQVLLLPPHGVDVPRAPQVHAEDLADLARAGAHHHHTIAQEDGLVDGMGDE